MVTRGREKGRGKTGGDGEGQTAAHRTEELQAHTLRTGKQPQLSGITNVLLQINVTSQSKITTKSLFSARARQGAALHSCPP